MARANPAQREHRAPRGPVTLVQAIRVLLVCSFTIAFLQYQLHSAVGQYLHLSMLFLAGLAVLTGRNRKARVQGLFGGGALLMTGILFSEAISYISSNQYSTLYGLTFIAVVLSARLVVQEIGLPNVLRSFSQAGFLTVGFILLSGGRSLRDLDAGTRFTGGTDAHPNLLAFVLGGFESMLIWRALEYKVQWKRWVAGGLAAVNLLFIYYSGSRGTLGAVVLAAVILGARRAFNGSWLSRIRLQRWHLVLVPVAFALLAAFLAQQGRLAHLALAVDKQLALNSSQRGLNSGLSGRTGIWHIAFLLLGEHNRWLFGFGYRSGDRLVGTIDNGYVQLLFDSGLLAGSLILGEMLRAFVLLWRASRPIRNTAWTRYYTMLTAAMIIYFLNNISARYLFSFGSSFSILIIFLMTASRRQLVGAPVPAKLPVPQRAAPPRRLAWNPGPPPQTTL